MLILLSYQQKMKSQSHIHSLMLIAICIASFQQAHPFIIQDLISTDTAGFNLEAKTWTTTTALKTAGTISTTCQGLPILGGWNILATYGGVWSKSYTNLPAHNVIQFNIWIYPIDSWDTNDNFLITLDSTVFSGWGFFTYLNPLVTNLCGNWFSDFPPIYIRISCPHTATSLAVAIKDLLDEDTGNESMGFRNITMTLQTVTSPATTFYGSTTQPLPNRWAPCASTNQYMSPAQSGTCYYCDSTCATCSGGSANQCLTCPTGRFASSTSCLGKFSIFDQVIIYHCSLYIILRSMQQHYNMSNVLVRISSIQRRWKVLYQLDMSNWNLCQLNKLC